MVVCASVWCCPVQVTVFMALLVLDAKRLAQSRLDCLPCLRVPYRDASGLCRLVFDPLTKERAVPGCDASALLESLKEEEEEVSHGALNQGWCSA
jgi:hypothetical protein